MEIIQDNDFFENTKQKLLMAINFEGFISAHIAATFVLPVL